MMKDYLTIGGLLSGFALLVAWMFITSRVPIIVRVLASTVAVVFGIAIWLNATALMGYAIAATPHGRVPVLGVFDDRDHDSIYIWVDDNRGPRAYQLPYSSQLAKKLLQSKRAAEEQGGQMVLRVTNGLRDHGGRVGKPESNDSGLSDDRLQAQDSLALDIDIIPILPPKE
jgi:hypothetical protein